MEVVPRLGVKLELKLPAYTTTTATQDLSSVCDLRHSSRQHRILNPLSEARDRTHNLMVTSQICFCCAIMGNLFYVFNFYFFCLMLFRAALVAYGGSQARGLIGAVATSLPQSHSNAGSKPRLQPTPVLTAILDP